jgi:hypothetical protein
MQYQIAFTSPRLILWLTILGALELGDTNHFGR